MHKDGFEPERYARFMIDRWLLFAAVAGAAYIASLVAHPYPLSWALKAVPALVLCGLALVRLAGARRAILATSFLAAAAGDAFLDIDRTANLAPGLGCFLVMQFGFAIDFARQARGSPLRVPAIAGLVAAGVALIALAWPRLGALRLPVMVYVAALIAMTATALRVRQRPWLARGALAFVVSDALIGVSQFVTPFPASTAVVVAIYYAAMLMIGCGLFGPPEARR
jgi:uncharacterized membrane protein YhhN